MKNKETLEEATDRLFKTHSNNTSLAEGHYDYMMDKEDFKEASLEIAKWQQEKSYSEEEVKNLTELFLPYYFKSDKGFYDAFDEFIEQFKKK